MDDNTYKQVFSVTTQLEDVLEQKFGARGKGLHAKALAIQGHLGTGLLKKIQFLATIRNGLAHQSDFEVPLPDFLRVSAQVTAALEALDPIESGAPLESAMPGRSVSRGSGSAAGRVVPFVLFIVAIFAFVGFRIAPQTHAAADPPSTAADTPRDEVPMWSTDHPGHAKQSFPWREEQASFVKAGETGALPNETLWRVVSSVHEAKTREGPVLEMDIVLGGGTTKGKVRFKVGSTFEKFSVSPINPIIEIPGTKQAYGLAVKRSGDAFGGFDPPFKCEREIPSGCASWEDRGVGLVAVSKVSFDNALKVVYGR